MLLCQVLWVIAAVYSFVVSQTNELSVNVDANNKCGYFVYKSTPIPLNICMQSKTTNSVMYFCNNNIISYNEWNNYNCTGTIQETNYFNSSDTIIYNCDATVSSLKYCNLAIVDIWTNPYCQYTPYYQLLYVIDVCVAIPSSSYSIYYGCNDQGIMKQDIYENYLNCSGHSIGSNTSYNYDSVTGNQDNLCFFMSCNNKTYISYDGESNINGGTNSFWSDPRTPEVVFIIAAGTVLILFWTCYFYRKCGKKSENKINGNNNDKEIERNNGKYDELMENEKVEHQNANEMEEDEDKGNMIKSTAMASIQKNKPKQKMNNKTGRLLASEPNIQNQ